MRVVIYCSEPVAVHQEADGFAVLAAPRWATTMSTRDASLAELYHRVRRVGSAALRGPEWLDLDFALAVGCRRSRTLHAAVGRRGGHRWYVHRSADTISLYDKLVTGLTSAPTAGDVVYDRLVDFFANAASVGPFDLASDDAAIVRPFTMVRRGDYRIWHDADFTAVHAIEPDAVAKCDSLADATLRVRAAIDRHLARVAAQPLAAVEVSGGIDSGIVLARLAALKGPNSVIAISAQYDYPEFAREAQYRRCVLDAIGSRSITLSGPELLPFANLEGIPLHDEPAALVSSWNQTRLLNAAAAEEGAAAVFTGHGGDRCFARRMSPDDVVLPQIETPHWMSETLRQAVIDVAQRWRTEYLSPAAFDTLPAKVLEPAWMYRYARAREDVEYCSGLLSRESIAAFSAARRFHDDVPSMLGQKPLARAIYPDALPESVWMREGKVNHVGLVYRGAYLHRDTINDFVRAGAGVLERAGVELKTFFAGVDQMTRGVRAAAPMTNAAISLAVWFAKLRQLQANRAIASPTLTMEL